MCFNIEKHGKTWVSISNLQLTLNALVGMINLIVFTQVHLSLTRANVTNFVFIIISQTIKCLLIYPNPDSALNEEAGRLLQERYDDYSSHARMMTEIHAKPPRSLASSSAGISSSSSSSSSTSSRTVSAESCPSEASSIASSSSSGGGGGEAIGNGATAGKKRPLSDKSMASSVNGAEKKKKDKKKALKRL